MTRYARAITSDNLACICTASLHTSTGSSIAQYCGRSMHDTLVSEEKFKRGEYAEALERAFLDVDEDLKKGKLPALSPVPTGL